ncbi:MAG: M20 family peptidase [Saprospiraceae bacterium]|nr:M20 family peptidase [Saprospiraceae bacterium]
MKKSILRLVLFLLIVLSLLIWFNTFRFTSRQLAVEPLAAEMLPDSLANRFAKAIRFPTISSVSGVDTIAFRGLDSLLIEQFPLVHQQLNFQRINEFSRVYHWSGTDALLEPMLLLAHLDVVPAENSEQWMHPPFSGNIEDGFIWGRGTLDDKLSAWAILETLESLLKTDFQPKRGIYIAFGHDEETSGEWGAASIAASFEEKGLHFAFVLDEGLVILENALEGLKSPVAMIGIAEKGICTLNVSVDLETGGHSMMPPPETAVGILAQAITNLQENPLPASIDGAAGRFFDYIGPEMNGLEKVVMANRWLTSGLLVGKLEDDPAANAMLRTTMAPTMIRGGVRSNILPTRTSAKVNVRIIPGESVESVLAYCRSIVDDSRVRIQLDSTISYNDPSKVSDIDVFGFQLIQRTCLEIYPDIIVAPSLVIGYTDSRNYQDLSDQIYRFCPVQIDRSDLVRIHGSNERIEVSAYLNMIRFYRRLIEQGGI